LSITFAGNETNRGYFSGEDRKELGF